MAILKSIYWEQVNQEELVYKFPFNNISLGSVLTVNEGQEAFFFKSGVLCDSFDPGRHALSSANLPRSAEAPASYAKPELCSENWT